MYSIRTLASKGYLLCSSYDDVTTATVASLYTAVMDSKGCMANSEDYVAFKDSEEVSTRINCLHSLLNFIGVKN